MKTDKEPEIILSEYCPVCGLDDGLPIAENETHWTYQCNTCEKMFHKPKSEVEREVYQKQLTMADKEVKHTPTTEELVKILKPLCTTQNQWNGETPLRAFETTPHKAMWIVGWPLLEIIQDLKKENSELREGLKNLKYPTEEELYKRFPGDPLKGQYDQPNLLAQHQRSGAAWMKKIIKKQIEQLLNSKSIEPNK